MNRRWTRIALRSAVSACLIAVLYSRINLDGIEARLAQLRLLPLVAVFPLLFLNTWISSLKWGVLLCADGVRIPVRTLFMNYMIAGFFNVFLPSNIGGDSYRIYAVARTTARAGSTVASVLADRLSGLLALSVLGFAFPLIGWELIDHRHLFLLPLGVFSVVVLLLALLCSRTLVQFALRLTGLGRMEKVRSLADAFLTAVAAYRRQPRVMARVMALSFAFHMTFITCVWLMGLALSLQVPFFAFCVYVPLVAILEALPFSIFGIGLRDAGYVVFMRAMDHPSEDGLALSVLFVAVALSYSAAGGLLFALRRRSECSPSSTTGGTAS
jgi:uncharacterized protein (TIRG00374 family)